MELTKPQKYLVVVVVIALIAAIAAGAWYLSKDTTAQEPGKDAKEMASKFAESYAGSFGPLTLNSTSTSDNAVVMKENDSDRLK